MSLNLEVQNEITRYLSVVPSMNRYTGVKVARWLVFLLSLPTREVTRLARAYPRVGRARGGHPRPPSPDVTVQGTTCGLDLAIHGHGLGEGATEARPTTDASQPIAGIHDSSSTSPPFLVVRALLGPYL